MKKILSILFDVLIVLVIVFAVIITIVSLSSNENGISNINGYMPLNIQSESMKPTINKGDMIIAKKADFDSLEKDNIISYLLEEQDKTIIITHRIVDVIKENGTTYLITKGDNNDSVDDVRVIESNFVGIYNNIKIPILGSVLTFLQSQIGFFIFIILPLFILFIYQLYKFINTIMEEKKKELVEQIRKEEKEKIKED